MEVMRIRWLHHLLPYACWYRSEGRGEIGQVSASMLSSSTILTFIYIDGLGGRHEYHPISGEKNIARGYCRNGRVLWRGRRLCNISRRAITEQPVYPCLCARASSPGEVIAHRQPRHRPELLD